MVRQAVLGAVLILALRPPPVEGGRQEKPASPPVKPAPAIPFSRLTPDAALAVGLEPGAVSSPDAVWVLRRADGTVSRINAKDNLVGSPVAVGSQPCASLVIAFDSVWVPLCGAGSLVRVDPTAQQVTATATVAVAEAEGRIASSVGSVWAITDRKGVLARIDPETRETVGEVYVPRGALAVEAGDDALWVISEDSGRLTRVNPHSTEVIEEIAVGPKPRRLAIGEGGVWTLNGDGTVTRVDPDTNKVVATIAVGVDTTEGDIAAGAGSVWVSTPGTPVVRIDPRVNRAVQRFTGPGGGAILVAHGSLWVAAGPQLTWRLDPLLVASMRP